MKYNFHWLKHILYPPHCAICGDILKTNRWKESLCTSCEKEIPFFPAEICPHCGGKTDTAGFCDFCLQSFTFESACASFPYEILRESIHLYKYKNGYDLGHTFGRLMAEYLLTFHEELLVKTDVILAVPLHPKKEKQRGFNQTHLLGMGLSEKTGLPFQETGLIRTRNTVAQSLLSPVERKNNLKDAFQTTEDFTGKRILLLDDIFTTGTTCNECAKVLYRAGAKEVSVFCLAAAGQTN